MPAAIGRRRNCPAAIAGRDGLEGKCILYYSHKDVSKLEHLMRDKSLSEREVGGQLINETVAYSESAVCRRKILLSYFGEPYENDNCGGMCDTAAECGRDCGQRKLVEHGVSLWIDWQNRGPPTFGGWGTREPMTDKQASICINAGRLLRTS